MTAEDSGSRTAAARYLEATARYYAAVRETEAAAAEVQAAAAEISAEGGRHEPLTADELLQSLQGAVGANLVRVEQSAGGEVRVYGTRAARSSVSEALYGAGLGCAPYDDYDVWVR